MSVTDRDIKRIAMATLIPLAILLLGLYLRPVWRDEIWALYMTQPDLEFDGITANIARNVHPPFYFYLLAAWRSVFDGIMAAKTLNLILLGLGFFAARRIGRYHPRQTWLFLLICGGSYWLIYFSPIIRPYLLMFVTNAFLALVTARLLSKPALEARWLILWTLLGAVACLTHPFNLVWVAFCGLFMGIAFLRSGNSKAFILMGFASAMALTGQLIWMVTTADAMGVPPSEHVTMASRAGYGANQFFRGLTTKLAGSNLALAALFIMSFPALIRRREKTDTVLLSAIAASVIAIFVIHITIIPIIKERSFMIIMPALLLLMTRSLLIDKDGVWRARLIKAMPIVIAISPLLFAGEYLKDRERISEVRAVFDSKTCPGATISAYYRYAPEGPDFAAYFTDYVLSGMSLSAAEAKSAPSATACNVKAIAIGLPRGEKQAHAEARKTLRAAGINLDNLTENSFGKGRHLVYTQP